MPIAPNDPASDANRRAWAVFERWDKPFICCFSGGDPITRGIDRVIRRRVPGAQGQPHATLRGGHFLQEDDGRPAATADIVQAHVAKVGVVVLKVELEDTVHGRPQNGLSPMMVARFILRTQGG